MKKLILLIFLAGSSACAADIDFLFDYDYRTPGCADVGEVNCVVEFQIRDQADGTVVATVPATAGSNSPVTNIPAIANGYGRLGNRTFAAYAIARDNEGGMIESVKSNDVTVINRPFAPANIRASLK